MKKKYRKLNLLPFYFRNIGLGIVGIALFAVLIKLTGRVDLEAYSELRTVFEILLLVGLLLIAVSQGRIEDERTLEIRTKVYAATFIFGVVAFILDKLLNFTAFSHSETETDAFWLLVKMFTFYFIFSWILKRKG